LKDRQTGSARCIGAIVKQIGPEGVEIEKVQGGEPEKIGRDQWDSGSDFR
jgi:hypothetical protein